MYNERVDGPGGVTFTAPTASTGTVGAFLGLSFLALLSAGALAIVALLAARKDTRALLPALLHSLLLPAACALAVVVCALVNVGLSASSLSAWAAFYNRINSATPNDLKAFTSSTSANLISMQNAWDSLPFLSALLAMACTLHAPGGQAPLRLALGALGVAMALSAGIMDSLYSPFFPFKDSNAASTSLAQEPRFIAKKLITICQSGRVDLTAPVLAGALLTLFGALLQLGVALAPASLWGGNCACCGGCSDGGDSRTGSALRFTRDFTRAEGKPLLAPGATAPAVPAPTAPTTSMASLQQRLSNLALTLGALLCQLAYPFFTVHAANQLCNHPQDQAAAFFVGVAMLQPFLMVAAGALTVAGGLLSLLLLLQCGTGRGAAQEI